MPLIDHALHALIGAVIEHDAGRKIVPLASGRIGCDIEAFVRDPVGQSLRLALQHLGQMIVDMHDGADEMGVIAGRVVDMDRANAARRFAILNDAWRGIGNDRQRWGA